MDNISITSTTEKTAWMVFYQNLSVIPDGQYSFEERDLSRASLPATHVLVGEAKACSAEEIFDHFNLDERNPLATEDGQKIVRGSGARHTSMSINDVAYHAPSDTFLVCRRAGWDIVS